MPRTTAYLLVAAMVTNALTGCAAMNSDVDKVAEPLTPEQSKTQVVNAAHDIINTLNIKVVEAVFWHSSCNDQGDPPFRGEMRVSYPPAASFEESDAEISRMAQQLRDGGWTGDADFHAHGTVLKKGNVVAVFGPQNVSTPDRDISILGECRDVTTTKQTKGSVQRIYLG